MKFINSYFDKEKGFSEVKMKHLNKIFKGTAQALPEDLKHCSEFYGCELAELKATIKACIYELKLTKRKYKNISSFISMCEQSKKFDKEAPTAKVIYHQEKLLIKRIDNLKLIINELKFDYRQKIKAFDIQVEKLDKIKK